MEQPRSTPLTFCLDHEGEEANLLKDIIEFHQKFQLLPLPQPGFLEPKLAEFRRKFLHEEAGEYDEALANEDLAKAFDSLIDLTYVALGAALLHGFDFAEGWKRVHAANMAKVRALREEDSARGGTYDIIKPEGWTAPDLSDLVSPASDVEAPEAGPPKTCPVCRHAWHGNGTCYNMASDNDCSCKGPNPQPSLGLGEDR